MRWHARTWVLALVTGALLALVPAAAQAEPGIFSFFAANCKVNTCKKVPPAEEKEKAELEGFTQAAGHPNFGITDFTINTTGSFPNAAPSGIVTHIRTDVAPGVATNPEAPAKCTFEEFGKEFEPAPGVHTHLFLEPECEPETEIGTNKAVVWLGPEPSPKGGDLPLEGTVYNLVQPEGLASDFGVALKLPKALTDALLGFPGPQLYAHTLIEGSVEWGAEAAGTGLADYHDYFEIEVSPSLPLISSRLVFNGRAGTGGAGDFLTNPTSCTGIGPQTTTKLKLEFTTKETKTADYTTAIGTEKCGLVEFENGFALSQLNKASDATDGITAEVSSPHNRGPTEIDFSQTKTASVTLPPGITLNASAAAGLEACTEAEVGIHTKNPINCPEGAKLGDVGLDVPGLPNGSLTGNLYLAGPPSGPITGPPYPVWVTAESARYGVIVRLRAVTTPDPNTGQLTTTLTENPEQPFSNLKIDIKGGPLSPLANSLPCEASSATTVFTPFTGGTAATPTAAFEVTGCASPLPFGPTQSTSAEPPQAGGSTTFALNFTRPQGHQYITALSNVLPPGLIGLLSTVTQCPEPQAAAGTCPSSSQIGTVSVQAGSGAPYTFNGKVYLTGPFEGGPFGLSIVVPPVAGPFSLPNVIARVRLNIDQHTAQVTATDAKLPSIVGGIPIRLRSVTISVNRQGFQRNPTNCSVFAINSTLTGSAGATASLSTPFQAEGCSGLAFKPSFAASSSAKTSRQIGASLETTITQPSGQANIKSVKVTLPKQLPSRLTTLQKACTEAVFAANPHACPAASNVGTARASTPALASKMTGPAYLVSHGGAAFPDLDLVLEGEGVKVILVGNTDIKKGVTTTTFATTPDVPVTSATVSLPTGPHSALAAFGDLCRNPLTMPAEFIGQNGKVTKQNTRINVKDCGVKIVGKKVIRGTVYVTVRTFGAGRITGTGSGLSRRSRTFRSAQRTALLKLPLTGSGRSRHRVKVKVAFKSKQRGVRSSSTSVTVRF